MTKTTRPTIKVDPIIAKKLTITLEECFIHLKRMAYASNNIRPFMPLTAQELSHLTDRKIEALDQYIYRFTKLRDTMGRRLFSQTLAVLGEAPRAMPFIDQLNRLEQLGVLASSDDWLKLRELRNALAHEYANNPKALAIGINTVFKEYEKIEAILIGFAKYLEVYLCRA